MNIVDFKEVKLNATLWEHFEKVAKKPPESKPEAYLATIYDVITVGIKKNLGENHVIDRDEVLCLIDSLTLGSEYSKLPFHWISWIIQNYTLYRYLTRYHPRKDELLKALESEHWYNAIFLPRKQELLAFIHNLMWNQVDIFNECIDRLRYVTPLDGGKVLDYYKQIGIRRKHFVQRNHPNSKLTTSQIIPYFVWDEYGAMFGGLNCLVLHNRHYCDDDLDIAIWLAGYKKWMRGKTIYEYEGVPVRIHHHNLLRFLELPKLKNGYDLNIHPKDWLKQNKQAEIDELIARTHKFIYAEFPKNEVIEKTLEGKKDIRIMRTAQNLIDESTQMENCVDGLAYVEPAAEGTAFFFHFDFPESKGVTVGICYNQKHDEYAFIEYSGFSNEKVPIEQAAVIQDFLQEINHTHWYKR